MPTSILWNSIGHWEAARQTVPTELSILVTPETTLHTPSSCPNLLKQNCRFFVKSPHNYTWENPGNISHVFTGQPSQLPCQIYWALTPALNSLSWLSCQQPLLPGVGTLTGQEGKRSASWIPFPHNSEGHGILRIAQNIPLCSQLKCFSPVAYSEWCFFCFFILRCVFVDDGRSQYVAQYSLKFLDSSNPSAPGWVAGGTGAHHPDQLVKILIFLKHFIFFFDNLIDHDFNDQLLFFTQSFLSSSLEGTNPKNILHNALASVQQAIFRHISFSSPLTMLFDHTWEYFLKETLLLCTNSRLCSITVPSWLWNVLNCSQWLIRPRRELTIHLPNDGSLKMGQNGKVPHSSTTLSQVLPSVTADGPKAWHYAPSGDPGMTVFFTDERE